MKAVNKSLALLLAAVILNLSAGAQLEIKKDQYVFTFKHKLACTSVKNQANTGTCWSFSTGSFLESEAIRAGKPVVDLSEMFWVRKIYLEKAQKYLRYHGKSNFGPGGLSHDVLRSYAKYGAMPESAYSGLKEGEVSHNHNHVHRVLQEYLDSLIKSRSIPRNWKEVFSQIMDKHLGEVPDSFDYQGQIHDARSFSRQFVGLDPSDYVTITSFAHQKPYSTFVLQVPDNFSDGIYLNVALEDLKTITNRALEKGHSVVWDCDVSEKGFSARQGLALVPTEAQNLAKIDHFATPHREKVIDAQSRQAAFDSYALTDDHLMHIVGLAHDQTGQAFYYVKNSWGEEPGLEGYLFASEAYLLMNTIGLTVPKAAIPDSIWMKSKTLSIDHFD